MKSDNNIAFFEKLRESFKDIKWTDSSNVVINVDDMFAENFVKLDYDIEDFYHL